VGEFFGSGLAPAPVRALMLSQSSLASGFLTSWWPMPFRRRAVVSLFNASRTGILSAQALVSHAPQPQLVSALAAHRAGHFHATSRRATTVPGQNWTLLSTRGRGKLVGASQAMLHGMSNDYLEGDERVFINGSGGPQIQGTGTEDFYEGGFYFNHGPFSAPFNGNPTRTVNGPLCQGDCTAAYRLLINDAIGFASSLRFDLEHGDRNTQQATYSSTAYWYG